MNRKCRLYFLFLAAFTCLANVECNNRNNEQLAAVIGNEHVLLKEIDNTVQSSLYESLYSIYRIRTIALDNVIDEMVSKNEATLLGITVDSMIANQIRSEKPPLSPALNLSGISFHSKGNVNSHVTFFIISDFTCSSCRDQAPILEAIYKKFKDQVHFKYAQFGADINANVILSECASEQGKYWQAYDYFTT